MFETRYNKKTNKYVLYFLRVYVGSYDSLEEVDRMKASIL